MYFIMDEIFDQATLNIEKTKFKGPFKIYTEYDLENLNYLQEQINISQQPKIDYESLLMNYRGQNVFSIFYENENLLDYLA